MAQASGVTCDQCGMFVAVKLSPNSRVTLPVGWYEIFGILESGERTIIAEVCSARCLERIAKVRKELDKPALATVATDSVTSINAGGGRSRTGHRIQHLAKGVVNPDCKYCQEETAP